MTHISFQIPVAGRLVSDSFLWPCSTRDVHQIKLFAVSLLGDLFGKSFAQLDPREIECKSINFSLTVLVNFQISVFTSFTSSSGKLNCACIQLAISKLQSWMANQVSKISIYCSFELIDLLIIGAGIGLAATHGNKSEIGAGVAEHIFKMELDEVLIEDEAYLYV